MSATRETRSCVKNAKTLKGIKKDRGTLSSGSDIMKSRNDARQLLRFLLLKRCFNAPRNCARSTQTPEVAITRSFLNNSSSVR